MPGAENVVEVVDFRTVSAGVRVDVIVGVATGDVTVPERAVALFVTAPASTSWIVA